MSVTKPSNSKTAPAPSPASPNEPAGAGAAKYHETIYYPQGLYDPEAAKIQERRRHCKVPPDSPCVGVGLSGGGIRSATFCLGVFQGLAKNNLIGKIDFLSTVSGGGFFGSFLGALFCREAAPTPVPAVEAQLQNSQSWPVTWLRQNGRYLSPNGTSDYFILVAAMVRNWAALHFVLLSFLVVVLAAPPLFHSGLWCLLQLTGPVRSATAIFDAHFPLSVWWSPVLLLALGSFLLFMLPSGAGYWRTQSEKYLKKCQQSRVAFRHLTIAEVRNLLQNDLTKKFTQGLLLTLALLLIALIDSLGQTLYARWSATHFSFPRLWAGLSAAVMVLLGGVQKVSSLLEKLPAHRAVKIPVSLLLSLMALLWLGLITVGLSVVTNGVAWAGQCPWPVVPNPPLVWPPGSHIEINPMPWLGGAGLLLLALIMWFLSRRMGQYLGFINLSSQQQLYAARLKRAYIGASNPDRSQGKQNYDVTNALPGDDIALEDYHPYSRGGPLHIINVTVNETVSGKTQTEQRDRKGLSLAVGPCGLTVGVDDHALWNEISPGGKINPLVMPAVPATPPQFGQRVIKPLNQPQPGTFVFNALFGRDFQAHPVESLGLGHWVAVSGAAFSTGMGYQTNLGMSLLLGLANVRLGYWWDSNVQPGDRDRTAPGPDQLKGERFARWFPAQSYIFDELTARFHGPARKDWYLTDGGHFENTAGYELIRRRVPFIIICDAGCDPDATLEDVANLVRKARIDFNAEIEFVRRKSKTDLAQARPDDPLPTLESLVHPDLLKIIGDPEDIAPVPGAQAAPEKSAARQAKPRRIHALLARVRYFDYAHPPQDPPFAFSWILFLKPGLSGDEPEDLLQYQKAQPDFPQETTADQFFDEAQWESYRKLGEHIASLVFAKPNGTVPPGSVAWRPYDMKPPR